MSTLWEITETGRKYLKALKNCLKTSDIPGMRGYIVTSAQIKIRLEILSALESGPAPESEFPGSRTIAHITQKWPKRALTLTKAQHSAIKWLQGREYIIPIGQA